MGGLNSKRIVNQGVAKTYGLEGGFDRSQSPLIDGNVQFFEITIASTATSNTATISSIDTTRSTVFISGYRSSKTSAITQDDRCSVAITNATTLTATRRGNGANTLTVTGYVVQFQRNVIKSKQSLSSDIVNATFFIQIISPIVLANTICINRGALSTGAVLKDSANNGVLPISATQVLGVSQSITAGNPLSCAYDVLEFHNGVLGNNTLNLPTVAPTATAVSYNIPFTVALNNRPNLEIPTGHTGDMFDIAPTGSHGNVITGSEKTTNNPAAIIPTSHVARFNFGIKNSYNILVQMGSTATTANFVVGAPVNMNKTILIFNGYTCGEVAGNTNPAQCFKSAKFTTSTNVEVRRTSATANANNRISLTVVEFV